MSSITLWMAFGAGLLSFLSPCILPVAPGYLGIISGVSLADLKEGSVSRRRVLGATLAFVLGFSLIFTVLGLTSSLLGQALLAARVILARIGGAIVVLLGLHQTGLLPLAWLYRERRVQLKPAGALGAGGAFLTGLAFAIGWTPCVGPILGGILTVAGNQDGWAAGLVLLIFYSLGLAVPFLLLALGFARVSRGLNRLKPYLRYLQWASGGLLILMGLLLFTNHFTAISSWLMRLTGGWNPEEWFGK